MNLEKANKRLDKIEQNTTDTTTAMITYVPKKGWVIIGPKEKTFATLKAAEKYIYDTTEPKTVIIDDLAYNYPEQKKQMPHKRI